MPKPQAASESQATPTPQAVPFADLPDKIPAALVEKLERLDIRSAEDLLFHLPMRYQDRSRVRPIAELRPGEEALTGGIVRSANVVFRGRRMLVVVIDDGGAALTLRFFNFSQHQARGMVEGRRVQCFGEARRGRDGTEMAHPEYRFVADDETGLIADGYLPIYPATEGLSQAHLRRCVGAALKWLRATPRALEELLPPNLSKAGPEAGLEAGPEANITLRDALEYVHRPPPDADVDALLEGAHPMRRRLAFEELLAHTLSLRSLRSATREHKARRLACAGNLFVQHERSLPFALTRAQKKVISRIRADLRRDEPMMRLLQGDVGSGKTLVAVAAMLDTVEAGLQAALMAPTEILAEQHHRRLEEMLPPLGVRLCALAGKQKAADKKRALRRVRNGDAQIVVGTHALFQEQVEFAQLALVVVDEQHRFGVHQRLALMQKGVQPHQLIMTATPIPRTLAMVMYADLDYSVIDELPPGRRPVRTVALPEARRAEVIARVRENCAAGRQAYWVCPLVEESDTLQCRTATDTFELLQREMPGLEIGLLHGRVKPDEKARVMQAFQAGEIKLLVATTVIEVGVDVPAASLMVVENAERFGLSQLHQLRGRIGRGEQASVCVLMYSPPLSEQARRRIQVMRETCDGFKIAQVDMEIRGHGEMLGTRQTGAVRFRAADIARDRVLLERAIEVSATLLDKHPARARKLISRWFEERAQYGQV